MSNNPTPPRIEREANKLAIENYISSVNDPDAYLDDMLTWPYAAQVAYHAGRRAMLNEQARAAPVVKALEEAYSIIANVCGGHPLLGELKQIIETYKADV